MMLVRNNGDLCFHVHSFETLSPESCTDTLPFLKGYIRVKIMKAMNVSMCDKPSRLQCYIMCEANQKRISTGQKRHTQSQNSLLLRSWCNRYVTYVSPSPVSIQWDMTPTAISDYNMLRDYRLYMTVKSGSSSILENKTIQKKVQQIRYNRYVTVLVYCAYRPIIYSCFKLTHAFFHVL